MLVPFVIFIYRHGGERIPCTTLILADTPPVDVTRADTVADLARHVAAMVAHDRPLEGLDARRETLNRLLAEERLTQRSFPHTHDASHLSVPNNEIVF